MPENRKPFLLRVEKKLLEAYQKWASDELRSLNGQLDYVLRKALKEEGRMPEPGDSRKEGEVSEKE